MRPKNLIMMINHRHKEMMMTSLNRLKRKREAVNAATPEEVEVASEEVIDLREVTDLREGIDLTEVIELREAKEEKVEAEVTDPWAIDKTGSHMATNLKRKKLNLQKRNLLPFNLSQRLDIQRQSLIMPLGVISNSENILLSTSNSYLDLIASKMFT